MSIWKPDRHLHTITRVKETKKMYLKKLLHMDYLFDSEGNLIVTRFRIWCAVLMVGLVTAISVIFATNFISVQTHLLDRVAVIALIWPSALALTIATIVPVRAKSVV